MSEQIEGEVVTTEEKVEEIFSEPEEVLASEQAEVVEEVKE